MLSSQTKTLAISVAIHGGLVALLAAFAARQVTRDAPEPIEIEIIPGVIKTVSAPAAAVPIVTPVRAPTPPIPVVNRPERVPKRVAIRVTRKPTPYQPTLQVTAATRDAPVDTPAVALPTAPLPEVNMETTVGAGAGSYSSTATSGSVAVGHGPGGDGYGDGPGGSGSGQGGGTVGPLANQGAAGVKVSRDWEITQMPKALNDGSFEPRYPPRARRDKREATVTVRLYINDAGAVGKAYVVAGAKGHGFRRSALEYVRKLRFRPALAGKTKVASRIDWTVLFYARN